MLSFRNEICGKEENVQFENKILKAFIYLVFLFIKNLFEVLNKDRNRSFLIKKLILFLDILYNLYIFSWILQAIWISRR